MGQLRGFGVGRASCAGCVNGHHSPTLISTRKKCPGDFRVRPCVAKRVADGYIGVMGGLWAELPSRQGKAFKGSAAWYRAKSPALEVAWPHVHEFAVLGSAPAISEGSGCGKEFFCAYPGQHLPCAPSHCLTSTGFIPLLSPATHAQKCTRRACSSSSAVQGTSLPDASQSRKQA